MVLVANSPSCRCVRVWKEKGKARTPNGRPQQPLHFPGCLSVKAHFLDFLCCP